MYPSIELLRLIMPVGELQGKCLILRWRKNSWAWLERLVWPVFNCIASVGHFLSVIALAVLVAAATMHATSNNDEQWFSPTAVNLK